MERDLSFPSSPPLVQAMQPHQHAYVGVHGECKIQMLLPYMRYDRICYSPIVHAFYRGVFRDWMLSICSTLSSLRAQALVRPFADKAPLSLRPEHALTSAQRKEIKIRMGSMAFTNEFGRVPESPLTHGRQQVMEQLIRMNDCVFPLLFAGVSNGTSAVYEHP